MFSKVHKISGLPTLKQFKHKSQANNYVKNFCFPGLLNTMVEWKKLLRISRMEFKKEKMFKKTSMT